MDGTTNQTHVNTGSISSHGDLSPVSPTISSSSPTQSKSKTKDGTSGTGKSKRGKGKAVYFWTNDDVNKWLRKHCMQYFQIYSPVFSQHDITGRCLLRMTDSKLQKMNITDTYHREELMRHIMRLKIKTEQQELRTLDQKALNFEKASDKHIQDKKKKKNEQE